MARQRQTRGKCEFCGREMTRAGMTKHLMACPRRDEAVLAADKGSGNKHLLYHLLVRDSWDGEYWLHIEMKGSAPLSKLDAYLRAIWLECCGHLSQFSIDGWRGEEISMSNTVAQVFVPEIELTHIYDFGTSSETLIKMVDVREGKPLTRHPIFLMARNEPPEFTCMECDRPATWLCFECLLELNASGVLCDRHVENHPHDNYGEPVRLVNSPRIGMCGYSGPAEPPY